MGRLLSSFTESSKINIFSHKIANLNSFYSTLILTKHLLFNLGIIIKNFNFQITKSRLKNFFFFLKRLFHSKKFVFKINIIKILNIMQNRIAIFYNTCSKKYFVGNTIQIFNKKLKVKDIKNLDITFIRKFHENNFICNIFSSKGKRFFSSPLTKALILNKNTKSILILTK